MPGCLNNGRDVFCGAKDDHDHDSVFVQCEVISHLISPVSEILKDRSFHGAFGAYVRFQDAVVDPACPALVRISSRRREPILAPIGYVEWLFQHAAAASPVWESQ